MSVTDPTRAATSRGAVATEKAFGRTSLELVLLGAIWGGSFLFMRVAAGEFGAFPLVEARLALGALVLLPFLWQARAQFTPRLWLTIAGIAAVNSVIPFALFAWGAERAPAGIGAITNALTVLFTALVAHFFYNEQIGARRWWGLGAGFIGVAILASGRTGGVSVWPAALAGATASLCYGFGINLVRRYLTQLPSGAVAAANLLTGSVLLAPLAIYSWPTHAISPELVGQRTAAGRAVHRDRVRLLLPPDRPHRRGTYLDGDLPDSAVRGHLGVAAPRGAAHGDDGARRCAHPRRASPSASTPRRSADAVRAVGPRAVQCARSGRLSHARRAADAPRLAGARGRSRAAQGRRSAGPSRPTASVRSSTCAGRKRPRAIRTRCRRRCPTCASCRSRS